MDKELQMACTEVPTTGSSDMLLATGGSGVSSLTPDNRDKRKKTTPAVKKAKGRKAKDTTPKGKVSAKVENPNGSASRQEGHGLHDKGGESDRGTKGADKTPRRSASELGIEWIGDFCSDGQPHFLVGRHNFDGGVILNCMHCRKNLWLPIHMREAATLDQLIDRYGAARGYQIFLDKHREAKCMVAKMQDLWYAKQRIEDNEKFVKLVISVMEDKDYDRKEATEQQ